MSEPRPSLDADPALRGARAALTAHSRARGWIVVGALAGIVILAAVLRCWGLSAGSLDESEILNLERSTGAGPAHLALPANVWIEGGVPGTGLSGAAPASKIWSVEGAGQNAPLYLWRLRLWRDTVGESDTAARALSCVNSLLSVVLMFLAVWLVHSSAAPALWAGAMMALAGPQISAARTVAPTAMATTAVLACFVIGLAVSRRVSLRGFRIGLWMAAGISAAVLLALLMPREVGTGAGADLAVTLRNVAQMPLRLFTMARIRPEGVGLLAAAFFLVPPMFARRNPRVLVWWGWLMVVGAWMVGVGVFRAAASGGGDAGAAVPLAGTLAPLAAPGVFALAATMLSHEKGWRAVAVPIVCTASCVMALEQAFVRDVPDFRGAFAHVAAQFEPGVDAVVFHSAGDEGRRARFLSLAFGHYVPVRTRGTVILSGPAGPDLQRKLSAGGLIWVISDSLDFDERLLGPAARRQEVQAVPGVALIAAIRVDGQEVDVMQDRSATSQPSSR